MINRVLVGLDGSPLAETVVPFAEALARPLGAEIVLLNVTPLLDVSRSEAAHGDIAEVAALNRRRATAYLHERGAPLAHAGVPARVLVRSGEPAAEILRAAEDEHADVIALATHGRSGMGRWVHGSVADRVLHRTTRPLLVVRPDEPWTATPRAIRHVVVPLDGSPTAEAALPLARVLASRLAVPLTLLRVVEPVAFDFVVGEPVANAGRITDLLRDAASTYLEGAAARERAAGVRVETVVLFGFTAASVVDWVAEHPGALVVLTTHARGGIAAAVLGSVTRRLTQLVSGPMLVVPPPA